VEGNQLTRTTARKSSVKDPEGTFQFTSDDFSSSSQSLDNFDEESAKALEAFNPGLAAAAKAFLGESTAPAAAIPSPSTSSSNSSTANGDQQRMAAPLVLPMAGGAQGQSPQPMLRIVGGVEAPTDRLVNAGWDSSTARPANNWQSGS
jgi:hypothetical protein